MKGIAVVEGKIKDFGDEVEIAGKERENSGEKIMLFKSIEISGSSYP